MLNRFLLLISLGTMGVPALGAQTDRLKDAYLSVNKQQGRKAIAFYHRDEPYYEFTNFWDKNPIQLDGQIWHTSEHYFQAQKFPNLPEAQKMVRNAATPRVAFDIARKYDQLKRKDWDQAKDGIMLHVVRAKFTQHVNLQKKLLETGSAILIERTKNDNYWATGYDGKGQNKLGRLLMKVRQELGGSPVPAALDVIIQHVEPAVPSASAAAQHQPAYQAGFPAPQSFSWGKFWSERHIAVKAAILGIGCCAIYGIIKLLTADRS